MSELAIIPDELETATDVPAPCRCGRIAVGFAILVMTRATELFAGEQSTFVVEPVSPNLSTTHHTTPLDSWSSTAIPQNFAPTAESVQTLIEPQAPSFSDKDFRPRGRSVLDKDSADATGDAPMMRGTNAWQRLADYRSHGRVRLLTLWEDGGSTLSLQAGKRGDPSLQWTSRSMNRGGATRGLFDELFSISLSSAGHGFKPAPHSQASEIVTKPSKPDKNTELK